MYKLCTKLPVGLFPSFLCTYHTFKPTWTHFNWDTNWQVIMRHLHYISKWARWQWQIPYFFDQMLRLLVFRCSWLLFKGDVYFHGKSADFNGGWIRPLWGSWLELAMFWHWTIIYTNCTSIQTVQVVLILLSYTQQLCSLYPFTFSVSPHNIKHENMSIFN